MNRRWKLALGILAAIFLVIQLVPYGRDHRNPPTTGRPPWNLPRTEELARRACFDCHSNETKWPFYASIAPISWRVQAHVEEGREHLNFSEFDRPQKNARKTAEELLEGEMPLSDYLWLHPEARLNEEEKRALAGGYRATFPNEDRLKPDYGEDDDETE